LVELDRSDEFRTTASSQRRAYPEPLAVPSSVRTELATARRIRDRNKPHYRLAHWPIWIFVFFLAPGPLMFHLFAYGFNKWMMLWLGAVLIGTGIAGLLGRLPGVEPRPYIIRFTEDKPNPWYRRICYTFAWSAAVTYAVLNAAGLVDAVITGRWQLRQIYEVAYFPLAGAIWLLGLFGVLPRVRPSTKGEGTRAPLFLRYSLGSGGGASCRGPAVGNAATRARTEISSSSLRIRGHSDVHGSAGAAGRAAAHAAHHTRGTGCLRLAVRNRRRFDLKG
jgi:hypothetical protein